MIQLDKQNGVSEKLLNEEDPHNCRGCSRWYTHYCAYVNFNKMKDPLAFRVDCPCSICLVKIICLKQDCKNLINYFYINLKDPEG